jgi:tetratricopeptide (TPR) repeat protein
MTRTGRILVLSAALAAVIVATGCSNQRSLPIVREHGNGAYEEGDYTTAMTDFQEYVDRRPYDARARYDLGRTMMELGLYNDAVKQLAVAHDVNPDRELYAEALAEALFRAGQHDQLFIFLQRMARDRGRVGDYIRLGEYTARAGDPDEAVAALLTAAELDGGTSVEPQFALARFYHNIGDDARALRRARMALWIDPLHDEVRDLVRDLGEVPGPGIALMPEEAR